MHLEPWSSPKPKPSSKGVLETFATSADTLSAIFIISICFSFLSIRSEQLGMYGDDSGFMYYVGRFTFDSFISLVRTYLPGRNLHIVWQYSIYYLFGGNVFALPLLHRVQAACISLNALMLFAILRVLSVPIPIAIIGALVFAFYPNHSEVLFWPSSLPMNIVSTFLALTTLFMLSTVAVYSRTMRGVAEYSCIAATFLSAGLGIFTYDQPVPLIVMIVGFGGLVVILCDRALTKAIILLWLGTLVVFVLNLILKFRDSSNGPGFGLHDLAHVRANFYESIYRSVGSLFWEGILAKDILSRIDTKILVVSSIVSLLCLLAFILSLPYSKYHRFGLKLTLHPFVMSPATIMIGVCFYFVSYLPNYFWFIATRHNYLPSVGIAITISGILFLLTAIIESFNKLVGYVACLLIGLAFGTFIFVSVLNIGVSREFWIDSYQARKNFYDSLSSRYAMDGDTVLVLRGFPRYLSDQIPVFAWEHEFAVEIMTGGKSRVKGLYESAVDGLTGIFVNVETEKFQASSFKFLPSPKLVEVNFVSSYHNVISFDVSEKLNPIYSISKNAILANEKPIQDPKPLESSFVNIDVPTTNIPADSVLAGLYMTRVDNVDIPLTVRDPNSYSSLALFQIPCQLTCSGSYQLHDLRIRPGVTNVALYVVSSDGGPKFVSNVLLSHSDR